MMAVPSIGPVTMADICTEFSAPATTPLHDFVRGGAWVEDITANKNVPLSSPITIDDLRGARNYTPMQSSMNGLSGSTNKAAWIVLGDVICSVLGGEGTRSYAFSIFGGDSTHFRIDSTTGNSCQVSAQSGIVFTTPVTFTSQVKCVVTDDITSIDVFSDVELTRT